MCEIPLEKLPFQLFGLCLQEPMGLLLNWAIALVAFTLAYKLRGHRHHFQKNWFIFFIIFGFSTFFGGLGHVFYYYLGFYGKIPAFTLSIIAAFFVGKAMINASNLDGRNYKNWLTFIGGTTLFLLASMLFFQSFIFVLLDTIIIYLTFCLGFGMYYWKKGASPLKFIVYGVLTLIPSALIFIFKFSPYLWLNENDLSHIFIIISLFFFYRGVVRYRVINQTEVKCKVAD